MNLRLIFLSIGGLNIVRGVGYYFNARHLTITKFYSRLKESDNSVIVDIKLHKSLGIYILALGIILLFSSEKNINYANKVLIGISIAYFISFLNGILQNLDGHIIIPSITLLFFFCCFLYSFFGYLSSR